MTITSVLPRDVPRGVLPDIIASRLGETIGSDRHERTGAESIRKFFREYGIDPGEDIIEVFMHDVNQAIQADRCLDSEARQAVRACIPAVREWLTDPRTGRVQITGWITGEYLVTGDGRFQLTGRACEKCEVNPQAYGYGGGVQCANRIGCGAWACF